MRVFDSVAMRLGAAFLRVWPTPLLADRGSSRWQRQPDKAQMALNILRRIKFGSPIIVTYPTLLAVKRGMAALLLTTVAADLCAQDPTQIYTQEVSRLSAISALNMDGLGESLSLYDGGVEFRFTDIDIKGNSSLPVRLTRYYKAQAKNFYDAVEGESNNRPIPKMYGIDRWQFEVPHITMTSTALDAWQDDLDRCSYPFPANVAGRGFARREIWNGHHLRIPGRGSQVLYTDDPTRVQVNKRFPVPSDGQVYRWITRDLTRLSCITNTANGYPGQGFLAVTPDGTKYYFNWGYESPAGTLVRRYDQPQGAPEGTEVRLDLIHVTLLATRIEDRFGNYVSLTYSSNSELRRIEANDGRFIQLTPTSTGLVATSSAGTWTYSKQTPESPGKVVLPDQSVATWSGSGSSTVYYYRPDYFDVSRMKACSLLGNSSAEFSIVNGLPSGVTATYKFRYLVHNRSGMYKSCYETNAYNYRLYVPNYWEQFSLVERRISGLGVPEAVTTYDYQPGHPDRQGDFRKDDGSCTYCRKTKTVTVKHPDQTSSKYIFGVMYEIDEGDLLETQELTAEGAILRRETNTYMDYDSMVSQPYSSFFGYSFVEPLSYKDARFIPVVSRSIVQNERTFTRVINEFDKFVRPVSITKSSDISDNTVKIEATDYHDDLDLWVLGQVAMVTCMTALPTSTSCNGNDEIQKTEYDSNAMPWKIESFGKRRQTLTYDTTSAVTTGQRGTLKTVTDGSNNIITLTSWKRGIPQQIRHPATTDHPVVYQKAVVNDNGWIDSVLDENGFRTCYTYDPMGRLASIAYPSEAPPLSDSGRVDYCDNGELFWKKSTISFTNVGTSDAYEVPAGHWRQTVLTGNNRKITIYDALWRPIVEQAVDLGNVAGTISVVVKRYDSSGRPAFQSYPVRDPGNYADPNLKGVKTEYDALDRVTAVRQDAEGGAVLSTTTVYTPDRLKTEVTNPNGDTTYTWYMAYDQPHYELPIQIYHPELVATDIARDALGKPLTVTRRSRVDSMISATRSYAYNPYHELCRIVEPETGTTWMGYDGVGNLAWSAAGLPAVTATTPCADGTESDIVARKVSRTYDARNRLKNLRFLYDTRGDQDWYYTPDGLPSKVVTVNVPGAVHPENHYTYNRRRLPVTELQALPAWYTFSLSYEYDGYGHLKKLHYPSGQNVEFFPNALGQATQVKGGTGHIFASNVTYHPNGAIERFVYGNGIAHTMTPNDRQLPGLVSDAGVFDLDYRYDGNGNVVKVYDNIRGPGGHRGMDYDGLDRLTHVGFAQLGGNHHMNFTYDALDNLKTWKHPTADGAGMVRDHLYCYNSKNQLEFIRSGATACSGSGAGSAVDYFHHDLQGNVDVHDDHGYDFDHGNRLREVIEVERYRYDAYGRRVLAMNFNTGTITSQYGSNGQLLYQKNQRTGQNKEIDYIYLGGSLIAQREGVLGTDAASAKYIHTDALGSPVAVTSQAGGIVENIVDYEPYGRQLDAAATIGKDRPGYTGHVQDVATKLTYMQQRYYDPTIGRFLSVDPITANSGTGASFNRYWYANNNPYRFTDPDGRRSVVTDNKIYIQPEDKTVPALPPIQNNVGASGVSANDTYFHQYGADTASTLTPQQAGDGFRNDPTPGNDRPASPSGTINNAGYILTNADNMVRSYTVPSPDSSRFTDVIVNYTVSGQHELTEGFVVRFGQINQDGSVTLRTYGEGNNWRQGASYTEPAAKPMAEFIWQRNQQEIIQHAGGK